MRFPQHTSHTNKKKNPIQKTFFTLTPIYKSDEKKKTHTLNVLSELLQFLYSVEQMTNK